MEESNKTRDWLFPDYGPREDLEPLGAFFDPSNLLLRTAPPKKARKAYDFLMAGELERAKHQTRWRMMFMSRREKLSFAQSLASGIHELRHFHDYLGTSCGFSRFLLILEDAVEFSSTWDLVKRESVVRIPLAAWGKQRSAPDSLRNYLGKRREFVEQLNLIDGSVPAITEEGASEDKDVALVYSLKGLSATIPAAVLNFQNPRTGDLLHKLVPIGNLALMEGTAFLLQRIIAKQIIGTKYHEELKVAGLAGLRGNDQWHQYMAADLYLTKRLGRFYETFQLALSDLAMMAEKPDLGQNYSGWRFVQATSVASTLGEIHRTRGIDLKEYQNEITERLGWASTTTVAQNSIRHTRSALTSLRASSEADSLWNRILEASFDIHLKIMELRARFPLVLVEPALYVQALTELPLPPILRTEQHGLLFQADDKETAHVFRLWYFFEHFQRQLLFSTKMPCPGDLRTHDCPGDPLVQNGWKAQKTCPFSSFMSQLGLSEARFEAAV